MAGGTRLQKCGLAMYEPNCNIAITTANLSYNFCSLEDATGSDVREQSTRAYTCHSDGLHGTRSHESRTMRQGLYLATAAAAPRKGSRSFVCIGLLQPCCQLQHHAPVLLWQVRQLVPWQEKQRQDDLAMLHFGAASRIGAPVRHCLGRHQHQHCLHPRPQHSILSQSGPVRAFSSEKAVVMGATSVSSRQIFDLIFVLY